MSEDGADLFQKSLALLSFTSYWAKSGNFQSVTSSLNLLSPLSNNFSSLGVLGSISLLLADNLSSLVSDQIALLQTSRSLSFGTSEDRTFLPLTTSNLRDTFLFFHSSHALLGTLPSLAPHGSFDLFFHLFFHSHLMMKLYFFSVIIPKV